MKLRMMTPGVALLAAALMLPVSAWAGDDCVSVLGLTNGDCNAREVAKLLVAMGNNGAAMIVLSQRFPEVQQALAVPSTTLEATPTDLCIGWRTWKQAERKRHPECKP